MTINKLDNLYPFSIFWELWDNSNKPLNLWYRWFSPDIIVNNSNIAFIFVVVHGRKGYVTLHKNWSFSMKDFSSKCDQIRSFLRIWSHLLDKSLMGNFIFSPVSIERQDEKHSTKNEAFCFSKCDQIRRKLHFLV